MPRFSLILATLFALLALPQPAAAADSAPAAPSPQPRQKARIYALKAGSEAERISFAELICRLADSDSVFLGEEHGQAGIHAMQLRILRRLYRERCGEVVLSMEQFERDTQGLVDDYLAGRISEADFLAASRPWPNYSEDYRPLVEFARKHSLPVIAANIPRPLASRVYKEGFDAAWNAFSYDERDWSAAEVSFAKDAYFDNFMSLMGGMAASHGGAAEGVGGDLFSMFQAQAIKDDTMAESIAAARNGSGELMLVVRSGRPGSERVSLYQLSRQDLDELSCEYDLQVMEPAESPLEAASAAIDRSTLEPVYLLETERPFRPGPLLPLVIHTNGHFHSDYQLGTVSRLKSRRPEDRISVVTMRTTASMDEALLSPADGTVPVADFLIVVEAEPGSEPSS